jgi:hypothetical protein
MPEMTLIDAIRQGMDEELAHDPNVFIVGEDVGVRGGDDVPFWDDIPFWDDMRAPG